MTPKVVVLMSTYNGEKYMRHQIDTILNQDYENLELFVRDDGSKDSTLNILEEYASSHANVSYVKGENLGSNQSFLEMVKIAPDADYYSLADQDDDWMPDKISHAVEKIESGDYLVYCSNKQQESADNHAEHTPDGNDRVDHLFHGGVNIRKCELTEKKPCQHQYKNRRNRNCTDDILLRLHKSQNLV